MEIAFPRIVFLTLAMLVLAFPAWSQEAGPESPFSDIVNGMATILIPLSILVSVVLILLPRRVARRFFKFFRTSRKS